MIIQMHMFFELSYLEKQSRSTQESLHFKFLTELIKQILSKIHRSIKETHNRIFVVVDFLFHSHFTFTKSVFFSALKDRPRHLVHFLSRQSGLSVGFNAGAKGGGCRRGFLLSARFERMLPSWARYHRELPGSQLALFCHTSLGLQADAYWDREGERETLRLVTNATELCLPSTNQTTRPETPWRTRGPKLSAERFPCLESDELFLNPHATLCFPETLRVAFRNPNFWKSDGLRWQLVHRTIPKRHFLRLRYNSVL